MSKTILPPWTVAPCIGCGDDYQATRVEPGPQGLCCECETGARVSADYERLVADIRAKLADATAERDALRERLSRAGLREGGG